MDLGNIKVLLAEDDNNVRITIKSMLQEMGIIHIHAVSNGAEAISYIDGGSNNISLIVCDWNMPHKTGIELLKDVRMSHPDLPFLMVTARADKDSVIAAKQSNVTAYICKPLTFNHFKDKVVSVLKK